MKPQIRHTNDGSLTLRLEEMDETYHSTHGAITEAQYVYIENGFQRSTKEHLNILEIGFGTGLNTLVTVDAFLKHEKVKSINYHSLEKYPVDTAIIEQLNYGSLLNPTREQLFDKIHKVHWETPQEINPNFMLFKQQFDLLKDQLIGEFDLIYYDAFAPSKQAEMWQEETVRKVVECMSQEAILVTYCAQGDAKRAFRACGLKIKRLPGPPGKWHMLLGQKV